MNDARKPPLSDAARGTWLAVTANLIWGFAALYWILAEPVDSIDLLAHRAAWSVPVLALALWWQGQLASTLVLLRHGRTMAIVACCATLSASNWGIFLWGISNGEAANASLGYFLLPLVNVAMGLTVFRERVEPSKLLAVSFALLAVALLIVEQGGLPLVALGVSLTFGTYSAIRKGVSVESLPGLLLETLVMLPVAVAWLIYRDGAGLGQYGLQVDLVLLGAGLMTVVPLAASVAGSRLLPLTALGLVFYIGPSAQLFVATAILDEPLEPVRLLAFGLVWAGLAIHTLNLLRQLRARRAAA